MSIPNSDVRASRLEHSKGQEGANSTLAGSGKGLEAEICFAHQFCSPSPSVGSWVPLPGGDEEV